MKKISIILKQIAIVLNFGFKYFSEAINFDKLKYSQYTKILIIFVLLIIVLLSCKEKDESEKYIKGIYANIVVAVPENQFIADNIFERCNKFSEKYPNITIRLKVMEENYSDDLLIRLSNEEIIDVFYLENIKDYPESTFANLNRLAEKYQVDTNDFLPNLIENYTIKDNLYAIPRGFDVSALFYNKNHFENQNISVPKTWEELQKVAQTLTNEDRYGLSLQPDFAKFYPFILSNGGNLSDTASEKNINAIDYYLNFITGSKTAIFPSLVGRIWNGDTFGEEFSSMTIGGTYLLRYLDKNYPNVNYGLAPVPVTKQNSSILFPYGFAVSSQSQHKDGAFAVIKWLCNEESQMDLANNLKTFPSRKTIIKEFIEQNSKLKDVGDAAQKSDAKVFSVERDFLEKFNEGISKMLENTEITTKEFLLGIQEK